jgi:hypothetical protein
MADLAGDFPGREVAAWVAAWTWLAADLRLGIVVLDGLDDNEIELVVRYAESLAQSISKKLFWFAKRASQTPKLYGC